MPFFIHFDVTNRFSPFREREVRRDLLVISAFYLLALTLSAVCVAVNSIDQKTLYL
jgi:hypothetical protein